MAERNTVNGERLRVPAVKPPSPFREQTEGVSHSDAKRIIEARSIPSNIRRFPKRRKVNEIGGQQ